MFGRLSIALLGLLTACNSSGTAGSACSDSSMCSAGEACINGVCTPTSADMSTGGGADMAKAQPPGPVCSGGGWCWQNPLPQGNNLRAVWASAANSAWAVGDGGTIIYWNGAGWGQQSVPTLANLNGVWGTSAANVYAVGNGSTVYHYDGTQWSAVANGVVANTALRAVWGSDAQNIWAVGADAAGAGVVYKLNTGTMTWAAQTIPANTVTLTGVWAADATDIWTVGGGGTILYSNNGTNFVKQTAATGIEFMAVSGYDNKHVFAVGAFGTSMNINATADGMTWTAQNSNIPIAAGGRPQLTGVWAADANHVWAFGPAGLVDFYNGTAWAIQSPAVTMNGLQGGFGTSITNVISVGLVGTIVTFNGQQYSPGNTGTTGNLRGVYAADATHAWAVGAAGSILAWSRASSRNC